jgi:hypothetical protein
MLYMPNMPNPLTGERGAYWEVFNNDCEPAMRSVLPVETVLKPVDALLTDISLFTNLNF